MELLAIAGSFAAHYYTKTRMGMLRHVVYLNSKWEKAFPIDVIKYALIFIVLIFVVFTLSKYFKNRKASMNFFAVTAGTVIISMWSAYFLVFYNAEINRAYYILGICFFLIAILQNIVWHFIFKLKQNLKK